MKLSKGCWGALRGVERGQQGWVLLNTLHTCVESSKTKETEDHGGERGAVTKESKGGKRDVASVGSSYLLHEEPRSCPWHRTGPTGRSKDRDLGGSSGDGEACLA